MMGKFKSDQKISSEAELSKQFNVSRQTVRAAITNLVNSGILYTVQGKGTFVGDNKFKSSKTHLIGFATTRYNNYSIFPKIISAIDSQICPKGYNLLIQETQHVIELEYNCLKNFMKKGIDALIIDPCKSALPSANIELYREFKRKGIPVLFFNAHIQELDFPYVIMDDHLGGYLAAKHLLDIGHRDICGIFKLDDLQGHHRYSGFVSAFREYGLPIPEKNIQWFSTEDYQNFWEDDGTNGAFLDNIIIEKLNRCSAMVAYNDYVTARIIKLLKKCNIAFPDDFSIVSFDDTNLNSFSNIEITSIIHPSSLMGEKLGKNILELILDPSKNIREVLGTEIVVRESTKSI